MSTGGRRQGHAARTGPRSRAPAATCGSGVKAASANTCPGPGTGRGQAGLEVRRSTGASMPRAQSMTLIPFGFVTRIPKPVGPGCGKTFSRRGRARPASPASTGMLNECHVPQVSETTPGSTAAEPDRRGVRVVGAGDDEQCRRAGRARRPPPAGSARWATRWAGPRQPRRVDAGLGDPLRRPAGRRDVVGRPGARVAPVDDRPAAEEQRVVLVPVHEPARPGRDRRVGPPPPQGPVDGVHPPRHVARRAGTSPPAERRAARHGRHVVAARVGSHEAAARAASRPRRPGRPRGPEELNEIADGRVAPDGRVGSDGAQRRPEGRPATRGRRPPSGRARGDTRARPGGPRRGPSRRRRRRRP